jgi:acyl-CoA thioester hydrolase
MPAPLLSGYPVVAELSVAWGEMDAFNHVNNVVYFRYFESARIACFERLGALDEMTRSGCGPILGEVRCRFRLPLEYPDRVSVGARVSAIGEDRFTLQHAIASERAGRIAAEGEGVIVWYDYRARAKAPLPQALRDRLAALKGEA